MATKKEINRMRWIIVIPHIAFWVGSLGLLAIADDYRVVRVGIFMNVPNSWLFFSFIIVFSFATLYHFWLTKQIKQPHTINEKGLIIYLDALVVLSLCFAIPSSSLIVNGVFDKSAPETFTVEVVDKKIGYSRYGIYKHIILQDWSNPNDTIGIRVGDLMYKEVKEGDMLKVVTKSGFLRDEWLVSYCLINHTDP